MPYGDLIARISTDPEICGGVACIRGTRIPVSVILSGLAEGLTVEEIIDHFPHLTADDVRAALAYAATLAEEQVWRVGTAS